MTAALLAEKVVMSRLLSNQRVAKQLARTIVCFSHLRWDFVFQRPQHLLTRAAEHYDVWYFEEPVFQSSNHPALRFKMDPSGVHVATPLLPEGMDRKETAKAQRHLVRQLMAQVASPSTIGWYYTPMALVFSDDVIFDTCVYDNMDELSTFAGAPPEIVELENLLFSRADVVFTGGQSLYEAKRGRHANIHFVPSSIDASHFGKARVSVRPEPVDQRCVSRPRIGFFGVIDERMDLGLVSALAQLRPSWHFMMIGPVAKIDPSALPQAPNVHWLGPKQYGELPEYLAGWDVGFMPFALNPATRFISPTKTPEFLAAGVPVVSTPIQDVINPYGRLGLVEIAGEPARFADNIEMLLHRDRGHWVERVDAHLAANSWDLTWQRMDRLIWRAATARANSDREAAEYASV